MSIISVKGKIKAFGLCSVVVFLIFCTSMYAKELSEEIYNTIVRCISTIIPSLFAMLCISDIMISTGIYSLISKPFSLISRYVMRIRTDLFFIFLLGNFAGYPVGMKLIADMVEGNRITKKQGEYLSLFCCAPSPSFTIGVAGICLFSEQIIGVYIYLSIVLSNFIIAVICGFFRKIPRKAEEKQCYSITSKKIISSVDNSGRALFMICTIMLAFSVIIKSLECVGAFNFLFSIFSIDIRLVKSFFEISYITMLERNCSNLLPIITALFSFGGLCIFIQIISICNGKISIKNFFIGRLICSILSFAFFKVFFLEKVINNLSCTASTTVNLVKSNNFISPICLLFMIIIFFLKKPLVNLKNS